MSAVYLGNSGLFELAREGMGIAVSDIINPSDVNADRDRFSMNFPEGALITGDMLEIASSDGSLLSFVDPSGWVDNNYHTQGKWYIFVDEVGGIRLYKRFEDCTGGEREGLVSLNSIDRNIPITYTVNNNFGRLMANLTSYTFSTTRETADVTSLSDQFRNQYSTLISGSGQLTAFFDYRNDPCSAGAISDAEVPIYLHQLAIRLYLGAAFKAKLYLISRGSSIDTVERGNDQVWYEIEGIISNVAISFEPGLQVRSTMDFITTGAIKLKVSTTSNYLVQEDGFSRFSLEEMQKPGFIQLTKAPYED